MHGKDKDGMDGMVCITMSPWKPFSGRKAANFRCDCRLDRTNFKTWFSQYSAMPNTYEMTQLWQQTVPGTVSPHQPNLIITRPGYLLKAIFGDIVSYDRTCCGRLWSEAILADIPPSQGPQPNGPSDQTFELPFASMPRSSKRLSSETLCLEFLLMKHTQTHKHVHTHTPQRWKMSRIWRIYPCKKIVKYG